MHTLLNPQRIVLEILYFCHIIVAFYDIFYYTFIFFSFTMEEQTNFKSFLNPTDLGKNEIVSLYLLK